MAVETAAGEQWQWELRAKSRPFLLDIFVRLIREKPLGAIGLAIAVIFLFVATFADLLATEWYNEINIVRRLSAPSAANWMGTDQLGRDFYSRIIYGARISVFVGFGAVIVGLVLGYLLGMISAWYGGWVDQLIMRLVDAWITIPTLVILLALSTVVPRGILPITLIIGLNFGIRNARLIRGYVLSLRENAYVDAARGIGASDRRIMMRHIAPNTFPPLFETFGTSGPRITARFFGGWDYPADLCADPELVAKGYAGGVPMGGDLPDPTASGEVPVFVVSALRDPGTAERPGGLLQRIQIIKGWADDEGGLHQAVYEVAGSADNGADVDLATCEPRGRGADTLCAVWTDPDFDMGRRAYYYARVLENPSCRYSTFQCLSAPEEERPTGCDDPALPKTIHERAWTSPIWYEPAAPAAAATSAEAVSEG